MTEQNITAGKPATNVGDGGRVFSAVAGSLLLYFMAKKKPLDTLLFLGGGYLLYRAVSGHCPVAAAFKRKDHPGRPSNVNVRASVIVSRPPSEVYAFWRKLENIPLFMKHIEHVDELDAHTSAWKMKMPLDMGDLRWEAKILKDEKDSEISWHSAPGAPIENTGKINFSETPGNATRVNMMISYRAPVGAAIGRLLTPAFREKIESDLHHFKHYIENAGRSGD